MYKVSNSGLNTPYSVKKCHISFYIAFKMSKSVFFDCFVASVFLASWPEAVEINVVPHLAAAEKSTPPTWVVRK